MSDRSQFFFSIVIPAHNEEKYVGATLEHTRALAYPKDHYGVIVVENGSIDKTFSLAKSFEDECTRVMQSEKGVSRAKNLGLENISPKCDWIIFLDADTLLERTFLSELNAYLQKHRDKDLVIGTTSVQPAEKSWQASFWFTYNNFYHRIARISFALQIMSASLKNKVKFDTERQFGEDLALIRDARRFGKFFFFSTSSVLTSTRRFEKVGWLKQHALWIWQSLVLARTSHKSDTYIVIR